MNGPGNIKLGAVRYLNARPLVEGLEELAPWARVTLDTPRRLAASLRQGSIDVGLVPCLEYPRLGQASVIPGISISSRGDVWSVRLVSCRPVESIRTLALDVSSLSSVTLARVLCWEKFGIRPRFLDSSPDLSVVGRAADGLVLIGDPAMAAEAGSFPFVYDLGREWHEFTGLPFVYAFWLARSPEADGRVVEALQQAKARGLARLKNIADEEARRLGLPSEVCREYLERRIGYDLGEEEMAGLHRFFELCTRHDLAPPVSSLRFAVPQAARGMRDRSRTGIIGS
ncbi:MAG: menaquinone biosynthesis protein [Planctomycetes bacterium]|nr:menaquinone biosynthesis protein [Planctomycetota bacterium]